MSEQQTADLEAGLETIPILDVHTHLVGGRLAARGLHDILLYHMAVSDLYAAGSRFGDRLTQYPGWPSTQEAHERIQEALPLLGAVANTSTSWGVRIILNDLYGWHEPVSADNWRKLDGLIRERTDDRAWQHAILDRAGIVRSGTELARRENGADDERLQYALEWAFFTRCQWGEYDTALYELERVWDTEPSSPTPIGSSGRAPVERTIHSLDDVHTALRWYVDAIPYSRLLSTATHLSTDIDYRPVSDSEMEAALARRASAGPAERDTYAAYINEALLSALEQHGDEIVFQFSFGAEPLPFETASRLEQRTIAQLGAMIGRHPRLRFQCFLASRHANQSLCTLARELPNLSLAGYWWHNFFPAVIGQVIEERLDMLPATRQIAFFSDAYCAEWAYAKSIMVRRILAVVLAARIKWGQFSIDTALRFARTTLFDSPQQLLGMCPPEGWSAAAPRRRSIGGTST